ncbi:MAG TPA: hypothetical protein VLA03_00025, partial [Draconibacterium sp.]|nr:hypothetical protein [Draconibacterium sp.]
AANRNIAYAFFTGTSNDVYKTTDNGASWTLFPQPDFYVAQSWFCLTIGVHPVNPNIVILGSVLWAYTTDGGVTWKEGAELEVDFHSVHFHASDPDVAYLGYDQGLGRVDFNKYVEYWTWNGSKYVLESQPEQLEIGKNAQFNTSQIYYGDYFPEEYGDAYLQGQQDGGCFGKVGINSSRIVVGDGGSVFINKQNPNKAFASTQLGRLYTTSSAVPPEFNYSRIDTFYNNHPNWITQFDGNNTDGNQVYFSDKENIQRTADGGLTFKSIATHALNYVKIAVQDAVDPIVYAVGYNSNNGKLDLITVMNAATNPTVSTNNDLLANYYGSPDHIEIDPNDANSIFLTTASGNAFKISDIDSETLTINSLKGDIEDVVFNTVIGVKNKPEILIAGTNIGLFYSTNSGSNWFLSNEIPYAQITDLKLRESDMRLFVFTFGRGSWAVTINTYPDVVQKIVLNAGWNIFSSNIYPSYPDLERISQSLIVGGTLDKIQEEAGNSFENWGIYGGWVNNIGDVLPTEGYKIKVSYKDSIEIIGRPIKYPLAIPLQSGWNIIGYGQTESYNGMDNITKQLIEKGSLIKVQDERGNSIEDWGIYGDWINNIGDFMPGEGYKIKVNKDDTLWIYESYPKSTDILPEQITLTHFIPEYQGNGVDHMNINLVGLSSNLKKEGDELAVFDGNTCVGAVTLTSNHLNKQMVSIAASASDKRGTPGFVEGNPILLKLWSTQKNMELLLEPEIVKGPVTFLKHKTTIGNLDNKTTTGLEKILKENITINCYPNPFSEKVSIEFNLEKESEISAEVINQMGQC